MIMRERNVKVTADALNVRKEAKTDAEIVKILSTGETVRIADDENGFGKLADNSGWIMLQYTEIALGTESEEEEDERVLEEVD